MNGFTKTVDKINNWPMKTKKLVICSELLVILGCIIVQMLWL